MAENQNQTQNETYEYHINAQDRIVYVGDNWQAFVDANNGAENSAARVVIGRLIWDYICGMEVRHLYETVFKICREREQTIRLLFRCDAPELRRYLQLVMAPLPHGGIAFQSRILRTESRAAVNLLRADLPHSDAQITMCSMCKKVETRVGDWQEIEMAINELGLFETDTPPHISHGLCPLCYQSMMSEIG